MQARDNKAPPLRGSEAIEDAIEDAIALYLGNFELLLAARTPVVARQVRDDFDALEAAVAAHAPWAQAELARVLAAHLRLCESLGGDAGELLRLHEGHTRVVGSLRAVIVERRRPPD
ncbi:hypothetical protein ACFPOE_13295 [Caenimonas terrae]|uniref:Uncharacterized protein n=1 Tax=Caenimonas terrae TaxID=696074 RepID=A0ABW0NCY4_9BURK